MTIPAPIKYIANCPVVLTILNSQNVHNLENARLNQNYSSKKRIDSINSVFTILVTITFGRHFESLLIESANFFELFESIE